MSATLRPRIAEIIGELLDDMAAKGSCDLISDFAFPLPAIVIAELLGVPASDREEFKHWSDLLAAIGFGGSNRPTRQSRLQPVAHSSRTTFGWLIAKYEREPATTWCPI